MSVEVCHEDGDTHSHAPHSEPDTAAIRDVHQLCHSAPAVTWSQDVPWASGIRRVMMMISARDGPSNQSNEPTCHLTSAGHCAQADVATLLISLMLIKLLIKYRLHPWLGDKPGSMSSPASSMRRSISFSMACTWSRMYTIWPPVSGLPSTPGEPHKIEVRSDGNLTVMPQVVHSRQRAADAAESWSPP